MVYAHWIIHTSQVKDITMSISISEVINGLATQQIHGLIIVLKKAKEHTVESGSDYADLLSSRLHPQMHPLAWQINTTLELLLRGGARLSGKEVPELNIEEDNFDDLVIKIESIQQELLSMESRVLDQSETQSFEMRGVPLGKRDYLGVS